MINVGVYEKNAKYVYDHTPTPIFCSSSSKTIKLNQSLLTTFAGYAIALSMCNKPLDL